MSASDWKKITKQLRNKPAKLQKFIKHNKPRERKTGIAAYRCEKTGQTRAYIKQYNIKLCRHAFREIAEEMGFKKYS